MVADSSDKAKMSFWEHLAELISRLRISIFSVLVAGVGIGFFPARPEEIFRNPGLYTPLLSSILGRFKTDLLPKEVVLIAGGIADTAYVYFTTAFLLGLMLASPVVAYEIYAFMRPALYEHERRFAATFVVSFLGLFFTGAIFSYLVVTPTTLRIMVWFIQTTPAQPLITLIDFVNTVIVTVAFVALMFTFPVFFSVLAKAGLVDHKAVENNRRNIYVGFIIASIILTADPTPVTDIILLAPFAILLEATIIVSKRIKSGREKPNH